MALQLQRRGIIRVHPLEGGLARWKALGFPLTAIAQETVAAENPPR